MQQTRTEELQDQAGLVGKDYTQGIFQKNVFWRYYQTVFAQNRNVQENKMHKILRDSQKQNWPPNTGPNTSPFANSKKRIKIIELVQFQQNEKIKNWKDWQTI